MDVLGQEVDLLRVVHVHPGRLGGVHVIDLCPQRRGPARVGRPHRLGLVDLRLDGLVAELGDVRAGVTVLVNAPAAEQHVQEVRRGRVVLVPGRPADVPLARVRGVLHERVLDAGRQQLSRGLVADRVQVRDHLFHQRLAHLVVGPVDDHLHPGGVRLLHQLLGLGDVGGGPLGVVGARGVRAVRCVGGEVRRQDLAGRHRQ